MLVQVLAEYADRYLADQLNDAAWESKPVQWQLDISEQGNFLGVTERTKPEQRGKKTVTVPMQMLVPRSPVNRNSGEHPLLSADEIAYVLGIGAWTGDKPAEQAKAQSHHEAFVALLRKAADASKAQELESCARFYSNGDQVEKARVALQSAKPGSLVALSVGRPLVECEPVRNYWRAHYQAAFEARMEGDEGECLISGRFGTLAPTHEKVKGVGSLGGQAAGVSLMSFDKDAFRSYGWERNSNSPVSPDRAMAYVLALNDLLRPGGSASTIPGCEGKKHRNDKAGVGFIFWTREPSKFDIFDSLEAPDVADVNEMLNLNRESCFEANQFYMAGLSGNGGRLRVLYWVYASLARVQQNIAEWHRQLRITWPWEDPGPVGLRQLEWLLARDGKTTAQVEIALIRRAIQGRAQPLGFAILSKTLSRLRRPPEDDRGRASNGASGRLTNRLRVAVGLIRLCINDLRSQRKECEMSEGLDETCKVPAYVCGRLMYVYESLQRVAFRAGNPSVGGRYEVNSTVVDRYFSLASTFPSRAFPALEKLGLAHLRKLRRDNYGAARNIDKDICKLHLLLNPDGECAYPRQLSTEQQGVFILGYYHQKAKSISDATDNSEAKKTVTTNQDAGE